MDIKIIFLIVSFLLSFTLGLFIFLQDKKNRINIYYGLFCIFAALWPFTLLFYELTGNLQTAIWWIKGSYIAAAGIAVFELYFALTLPEGRSIKKLAKILILFSFMILSFLLLIPNFLTKEIVQYSWGKETRLGKWEHILYSLYFLLIFYGALVVIWKKYKANEGIIKIQLLYIFLGILIPSIFGAFFNLILPSPWFQNFKFIWIGPSFSMLMVFIIAYAIMKHHLMNIKIIATELLTALIIIFLLVEVFLSQSYSELLLRIGFLFLVSIFSILLIRSVLGEVTRREAIQKLMNQLERAYKKLQRLDTAKSEFISIASHQLRTPLSINKGYLSMVIEGSFGRISKKLKNYIDRVYQSNERLIKLVNSLLNISRIESDRMEYHFQMIQLGNILQSVTEEFSEKAKNQGIKLEWKKPQKKLPEVKADPDKIREVIANLVDNALKYTKKGKVLVLTEIKGNNLIVRVSDSGVGISSKEIDNLFQKFSRGKEVAEWYTEGVGLGLYICSKLIEAHGGKVWAKSKGRNKGSVFSFYLPLS